MLTILNKELRSYFYSATAYIFIGIFLFMSGIFFSMNNIFSQNAQYSSVLSSMVFIFLLISPILTMKTIAEEKKSKTDQLLLTSPQSISGIVLGKYLAAVCLFLVTLIITLLFPVMLNIFGKVDFIGTLTSYLGFFLMGSCFIAIGIFVSSITESQVVAAVGSLGILLLLWLLDSITSVLPTTDISGVVFIALLVIGISYFIYMNTRNIIATAGTFLVGAVTMLIIYIKDKTLYEGVIVKFLGWLSLIKRNQTFDLGIISVSSIIYFISFAFIFVFLTIRVIEKRRWN